MEEMAQREIPIDETLPWDTVDVGITKEFYKLELEKAMRAETTRDCRLGCNNCGLIKTCREVKKV